MYTEVTVHTLMVMFTEGHMVGALNPKFVHKAIVQKSTLDMRHEAC